MGPVGRKEVESLLRDGAWLVRAARALVASGDAERVVPVPPGWALLSRTIPLPQEALARAELRLGIADAVLALEEPGRQAVILRLFEAQPLPAIARLTRAPEEVVRTRVSLGVAQVWATLQAQAAQVEQDGRRACAAARALLVARLERLARAGTIGSEREVGADSAPANRRPEERGRRWWWLPS